jgi:hypothetical protein
VEENRQQTILLKTILINAEVGGSRFGFGEVKNNINSTNLPF